MALEVDAIHTYYGESHVLHGISLRVDPGEVLAILGRNGMGKTTLIRTIVGFTPAREGRVRYEGTETTRLPPFRMAALGMALVPQGRRVFVSLSVRENLEVARAGAGGWNLERVYRLFPRLRERAGNRANKLSGGEQQMLAIARALSTHPKLLILDEATEGLAPVIREEIWRCLATLKAEGEAILVVDKYVQRLLPLADRHLILERGRVVWTGDSAALDADRGLWTRYLGV